MEGNLDIDMIKSKIDGYKDEMVQTLIDLVAIPAISPENGGEGELKRAEMLTKFLNGLGVTNIKRVDYKDESGTIRPNLISKIGNKDRTIWLLCHMDTVATGDLSLWKHDPFKAYVEEGKIYGRGTNDNGQALVATLYALKALLELKADLKYNFGIAFVADEEVGSHYGAEKLVNENIFSDRDMIIVPDWGVPNGDEIEVGEKGILWLKVVVEGKQVHASTPQMGINAFRLAVKFLNDVDKELHSKYNLKNDMFDYPLSTFEMTKHEKNVDSVNIIPGLDVSYIDCRVLPNYKLDDVLKDINAIAEKRSDTGKVTVEVYNREDPAIPTDPNSEVVKLLSDRIKQLRRIDVKPVGIGGGTVAKYFRDKEIPAAVWSTEDDIAHQPNEYSKITDLVEDSKVFASLFI
jgi:succinyl-diaminopimelate desuccinylase